MKDNTRPQLSLVTHQNGYGLTIDGENFMYFSVADLLVGFNARLGSGKTEPMDRGNLLYIIFETMLGQHYSQNVDALKKIVSKLEADYKQRIEQLDAQLAYIKAAIASYEELKENIKETTDLAKKMAEDYKKACQPYDEYNRRILILENDMMKVESKFSHLTDQADNKLTIIYRKLESIEKKDKLLSATSDMLVRKIQNKLKTEVESESTDNDEKVQSSEPQEEEAPKQKRVRNSRNRNKEADEQIIKEIEKQKAKSI